jgi:uncharacterized protein YebE (UPF0316 family)
VGFFDTLWAIMAGIDWYDWAILPIIIFLARICDVTLGTIRIILVSRGKRNIAPILGFCEVLIWIVVIGQLVQHLHSITAYIAYASGFAAGNFIGMYIEDKLAFGMVIVRTILQKKGEELIAQLHTAGFGVTSFEGKGANGPVCMIFTIIKRQNLKTVLGIIHQYSPKAFISVEDVRSTEDGVFPSSSHSIQARLFHRKSK